jgi:pteridine reductase
LTRVLALELAPDIRVNAVAPGTVAFPPDFTEAQRGEITQAIPLGRVGEPQDVARAVGYLHTSGHFVTGQSISVDGGRSAC